MASHLTNTEFQIGTTQTINGISTTISNNNSEVPTSKAVRDFIDNTITPVSLTVSGNWSNSQYTSSPIDITGLTFTVTYKDGTTASVTPSVRPLVWPDTAGTQAATFSYTEHGVTVSASKSASVVVPPWDRKQVGGTIFYIESNSTNSYTFYDASGAQVSAPTVGTNCTGWTYEKSGDSVDKFYVVYDNWFYFWSYDGITTGATDDSIGSGKTNTDKILSITDTSYRASNSVWKQIKYMRDSKICNCDDWFIGCKTEVDLLKDSEVAPGLVSYFTSRLGSSNEYNSGSMYMYNGSSWGVYQKDYALFCSMRSF